MTGEDDRDLGRYRRGEWLPLLLVCRDNSLAPVQPIACPVARLYGPDGSLIRARPMPACDRGRQQGVFLLRENLDGDFSPGRYGVLYGYRTADGPWSSVATFEVLDGGDAAGSVISMFAFRRPDSLYIVAQVEGGRLLYGRGPGLS